MVGKLLDYPKITSMSFLLKLYDVDMTAIKAKQILVDKGILIKMVRTGAGFLIREFHALTRRGLKYGDNIRNPVRSEETQIHYCIDEFQGIADILNEAKAGE